MQNFKIGLIYFEFVGNKAKGRISIKQENNLQENKKTRKQENNLQENKKRKQENKKITFKKTKHAKFSEKLTFKCLFFGKFGVLCFLETPVLRFALLPYYRRIYQQDFLIFTRKVLVLSGPIYKICSNRAPVLP